MTTTNASVTITNNQYREMGKEIAEEMARHIIGVEPLKPLPEFLEILKERYFTKDKE